MEFNPGPDIIDPYFQQLSEHQKQQLVKLGEFYAFWNSKINVISRKDMTSLYQNHVLHSLGIAKVQEFKTGDTVLDVGTGGGFPGIPLAIMFPNCRFHLIDSIGKKIQVVEKVIEEIGLTNASCQQVRMEELNESYQYVVCRAVAKLHKLIQWTRPVLAGGGQLICLKGGDLQHEIDEIKLPVKTYHLSAYFKEPFFETKQVLRVSF